MHHPYVWLDVNALVFFNIHLHRVERAGYDVFSALGKFHASPFLPFGACAANGHGFVAGLDDLCSQACMDSQPRVKGQALVSFPGNVIVNAGQWIFAFFVGAHRCDQILESFGLLQLRAWLEPSSYLIPALDNRDEWQSVWPIEYSVLCHSCDLPLL